MTAKWVLPAWAGPGSPQSPVRVDKDLPGPVHGNAPAASAAQRSRAGEPNVPPVFPRLEVQRIATCPECFGDCIDEGVDMWCPRCRASWTFAQVGYFEDGDIDD